MEVYLDSAASSRPYYYMVDDAKKVFNLYGNPSSLHTFGKKSKKYIEESRKIIADYIGAKSKEIYFTSGGSESNNLALKGIAPYLKKIGKTTIVASSIEHKSVLRTCEELEKDGFEIIYMPVDEDCRVDIEEFEKVVLENKDKIGLVYIMSINNEVGSIQLIEDIGMICEENNILFGTDAVQGLAHMKFDVDEMNISLMSMSGHKVHAPKGIGALYVRDGVEIAPIISGGNQENGLRAGTENVASIITFGRCIASLERLIDGNEEYAAQAREFFLKKLDETGIEYKVNCDNGVPGIISLTFPGCEAEALLLLLDSKGVYVSAGSACTSGELNPSHVLTAMGLSEEDANCTIRVSFDEAILICLLEYAVKMIAESVKQLRSIV